MDSSRSSEDVVRQLADSLLALIKSVLAEDRSQQIAEVLRAVRNEPEAAIGRTRKGEACEPLLLNARQAAKCLSISQGTLFNMSAPRGPIPVVKINARTCYAVADLKTAIESLKIKSRGPHDLEGRIERRPP